MGSGGTPLAMITRSARPKRDRTEPVCTTGSLIFETGCAGGGWPGRGPRTGPFLRKEVIQPQVPLRLPCYDFTPVADRTVVGCLLAVSAPASGKANSHGVTGGVYKARERIHRGVLIRDY